jgi:hypothetical protein
MVNSNAFALLWGDESSDESGDESMDESVDESMDESVDHPPPQVDEASVQKLSPPEATKTVTWEVWHKLTDAERSGNYRVLTNKMDWNEDVIQINLSGIEGLERT